MPRRDGFALAEVLTRDRQLPVLFVSGQDKDELVRGPLPTRWAYLPKPVFADDLLDAAQRLLDAETPEGGPSDASLGR